MERIIDSCEVNYDCIICYDTQGGYEIIDKSEFETWVDSNELRIVLVEKFDGEYSNHDEKLSFEEFYDHSNLRKYLQQFTNEKQTKTISK